ALECMGDRLGLCGVHELEDRSQVDVLATVLDGRASSAAGGLPLVGGAEAGAVRDACGRGEVRIRRGRLPTARALVLVSDLMGLSGDVVGDVGVERDHVVRDAEE